MPQPSINKMVGLASSSNDGVSNSIVNFYGQVLVLEPLSQGAFLDLVIAKFSPNRPLPIILTMSWFRWMVFILFMAFLIFRIGRTAGDLILIGSVFVRTCLLTTIIAVILGMIAKHRGWYVICPMGFIQERLSRFRLPRPSGKP